MNNPFDYVPDEACRKAFGKLLERLELLKKSPDPAHINFLRELSAGKMLGVLIAKDPAGGTHELFAFSGQLGDGGFHFPGFVGPVFDYLQPDGYFKTHEAQISQQNREIAQFETVNLKDVREAYVRTKERGDREISECKEKCRRWKAERNALRARGDANESELADMIRRSQFEKAELHRLKQRVADDLAPYASKLADAQMRLSVMKDKRRCDSEALQQWLFSGFTLLNARGESRSLSDIFADTPFRVPPSGAGECCAPKLLQTAYAHGWQPLSIAEYWYGAPKDGEVRLHGEHYPACRGKCGPVLAWMLQGLTVYPPIGKEHDRNVFSDPRILFENEWFCVVDKPSGILSVPGKGKIVSVQEWLEERYGSGKHVKMAHRLDQDTSGLLIAAFGDESYRALQALFGQREINKTYVALLEGDYRAEAKPREGRIELPLIPDWLDRPRQRVDFKEGKEAVTDYEFISVSKGYSRVKFHPCTGRTHQLRMHAASSLGLGMPIAGDSLYGSRGGHDAPRLMLHAHKIAFTFPLDGRQYSFESPLPF